MCLGTYTFSWVLRGLELVSRQISLYSWNVPLVSEGTKPYREVGARQCENPKRGLLGSSWGYENTVGVGLGVPGLPTTETLGVGLMRKRVSPFTHILGGLGFPALLIDTQIIFMNTYNSCNYFSYFQ